MERRGVRAANDYITGVGGAVAARVGLVGAADASAPGTYGTVAPDLAHWRPQERSVWEMPSCRAVPPPLTRGQREADATSEVYRLNRPSSRPFAVGRTVCACLRSSVVSTDPRMTLTSGTSVSGMGSTYLVYTSSSSFQPEDDMGPYKRAQMSCRSTQPFRVWACSGPTRLAGWTHHWAAPTELCWAQPYPAQPGPADGRWLSSRPARQYGRCIRGLRDMCPACPACPVGDLLVMSAAKSAATRH